jgi:hypothetical protein
MNPFEFLNSINTTKKNLITDDITEKAYNAYIINRSLSYFPDSVLAANEMNINHHLDNKLQYDFFINIMRKRKRFSKWEKKKSDGDVEVIKQYYGYNDLKARQVVSLLSPNQLQELHIKVSKGGRK